MIAEYKLTHVLAFHVRTWY